MSIVITSTADSPEQVAEVIERAGMKPEPVETTEKPVEAAKEEPVAPAPTEQKPEGKTEGEPEPPKDQEKPKEGKQEEDDAEEPERDEKGRFKGKGVQKKIDRLTKERYEEHDKRVAAEARLAELQKQLDEAKNTAAKPEDAKQPEKKEPEKPAEKAVEAPEPLLENFDGPSAYEDWVMAHAKWQAQREVATVRKEIEDLRAELKREWEAQHKAARQQDAAAQEWAERVDAAREKHSDWDTVMKEQENAEKIFHAVHVEAVYSSDLATEILYHLAKHPEEAKQLASLTDPKAVSRAVGKLEAKLSVEPEKKPATEEKKPAEEKKPSEKTPEPPKPRPSAAPEPIKPVGGASAAPVGFDPYKDAGNMTPQQWAEWREKNRKKSW